MMVGRSLVRFDYEVHREGEKRALASGFTEHATVGREGRPVRLPDELDEWLTAAAKRSALPRGQIIRERLEQARKEERQPFLRLAGIMPGPRDLSNRKGFSRT